MTEQWTFDGSPPVDEDRMAVTLVEGSTFCISLPTGDIRPGPPHGLFFRDTRILSRWEMRVDGHPLQPLVVEHAGPFAATYVCRARPRPGHADATILVNRRRYVGDGMREDIVLENLSGEAAGCTVTLLVDADFADLFEVKEDRVAAESRRLTSQAGDAFHAECRWMGQSRGVRVTAEPVPDYLPGVLSFQAVVPARGRWEAVVQVQASVNDVIVPGRHAGGEPVGQCAPQRQLSAWREQGPSYPYGPPRPAIDPATVPGGPRRATDLRCAPPGAGGRGSGGAVVHVPVRPRLAAVGLDGPARRPETRDRHAADARPLPGGGRQPPHRGTARPHHARTAHGDADRADAGRGARLLRDGGRDVPVRHAARRGPPLGWPARGGRRPAARRRPGPGLDP